MELIDKSNSVKSKILLKRFFRRKISCIVFFTFHKNCCYYNKERESRRPKPNSFYSERVELVPNHHRKIRICYKHSFETFMKALEYKLYGDNNNNL